MPFEIKLIESENLSSIIPLLKLLNPTMTDELLIKRLNEIQEYNYNCIGIYQQDKLVGISGFWILYKIYSGKHIEPDNVIIDPSYRNQNLGAALMKWIHDYAAENNCNTSELNCFTNNHKGYKFWIEQGYEIIGFHMIKKIQG